MPQIGYPQKNQQEPLGDGYPATTPAAAGKSSFILGQNLVEAESKEESKPTSDLTPIPNPYRVGVGQPDLPVANTKMGTLTPSTAKDANGNRIIDSDLTFSTTTRGGAFDMNQQARASAVKASKIENGTVLSRPLSTGYGGGAFSGGTPGAKATASLVVQDLTYTAVATGVGGNEISIAYLPGGTAGSEVVAVTGKAITVTIQSGVSTATQVRAKLLLSAPAMLLVSVVISGTPGTAQVSAAAKYMIGGVTIPLDGHGNAMNGTASFSAINRVGSRNHASINVIARPGASDQFLF